MELLGSAWGWVFVGAGEWNVDREKESGLDTRRATRD